MTIRAFMCIFLADVLNASEEKFEEDLFQKVPPQQVLIFRIIKLLDSCYFFFFLPLFFFG